MNIEQLGWNKELEESFKQYDTTRFAVARVSMEHKGMYRVLSLAGDLSAEVTGKLRFEAKERRDFPAVGDWVVISLREGEQWATIHSILPRKSLFSRKVAGVTIEEQIVATNIDTVFLVMSLNQDFNLRRLERYLIMAWESGANPVIILSKADLNDNIDHLIMEIEQIAYGVPTHVISTLTNQGLDELQQYLTFGHTIALLGSSGVGKSTLINSLLGQTKQLVQDIRDQDDRGRHTTTHRELIVLPKGGVVIDTPGMRELQLWESNQLDQTFSDIEIIASQCHFRDCRHESEPGCSVKRAIEDGTISQDRFNNFRKLQKELAYLEKKSNKKARKIVKNNLKKSY